MTKNAWAFVLVSLGVLGLAGCGGGGGTPPPPPTVSISPQRAAVAIGQTQQFNATVTGVSNTGVTWSVDGTEGGSGTVGTISASGLYTPPSSGSSHTVTAASTASPSTTASATIAVTDLAGVFTYHNDSTRAGANTQEYALSSTTVTTSTFGKLFSCAVDGAVYTQPLWVPGLTIGGGTHNVLLVATQHDSVYVFDADANPCVTYWQAHLLDSTHGGTAGEQPVVWQDVGYCYGDIYPEVGVTGTPVIDSGTQTIYLVSASEIPGVNSGNCSLPQGSYFHKLHALDILTGNEKFNAPVAIAAQVVGNGDGSSGGFVSFASQLEHNRSGLALNNGTVYVAFAAHEDASPYHGWVLGYNGSDLTLPPSVFNTTPNGGLGGIWGGGGAPAIDATGDVYVATGNGIFDASSPIKPFNDYGDSVLRLHPSLGLTSNGVGLSLVSWFTPWDQATLSSEDADLGFGAPVLLPDQTVGPAHLLAEVGKDGLVRLINRDNMGQINGGSSDSQILQFFTGPVNGLWGTPAFWQNSLYVGGQGDSLRQFTFDSSTGLFNTTTASFSSQSYGYPGVTPSISSQGASNGILWGIDSGLYGYASPNAGVNCGTSPLPAACTGPAVLHAYDATNLAVEYWNSTMASGSRDQAGNAVKFVPPTIANGKVYVGTRTEVDVYGLLP